MTTLESKILMIQLSTRLPTTNLHWAKEWGASYQGHSQPPQNSRKGFSHAWHQYQHTLHIAWTQLWVGQVNLLWDPHQGTLLLQLCPSCRHTPPQSRPQPTNTFSSQQLQVPHRSQLTRNPTFLSIPSGILDSYILVQIYF